MHLIIKANSKITQRFSPLLGTSCTATATFQGVMWDFRPTEPKPNNFNFFQLIQALIL